MLLFPLVPAPLHCLGSLRLLLLIPPPLPSLTDVHHEGQVGHRGAAAFCGEVESGRDPGVSSQSHARACRAEGAGFSAADRAHSGAICSPS